MNVKQAIELAKQNNYQEALHYFKKAYELERDSFNEWGWYYYCKTLAKVNQLEAALKINHFLFRKFPDFDTNTNLYSWNLYKHVIKNATQDEQMFSTANFIVQNTKQDKFSAYERTVLDVLKYIKNKPSINYQQLLHWCEKLDPKQLSKEPFSFVDENGKTRSIASPLETWYQYRIKAYFETKQYENCRKETEEALFAIPLFHYNNDLWFQIKAAVSIANLGDLNEAIKRLQAIALQNQHWTIFQELFLLYKEKEDFNKALEIGANALLERSGELKHKIKVLLHMGDLLEKTGNPDKALLHYCLVTEIRRENQWPINQKLEERIETLKAEGNSPTNVKGELIRYWKNCKFASIPKGTGVVKSILPKGNAGFITTSEGEDLFFHMRNVKQKQLNVTNKVSFHIINSYNQKKQCESKEAIEIVVLKEK